MNERLRSSSCNATFFIGHKFLGCVRVWTMFTKLYTVFTKPRSFHIDKRILNDSLYSVRGTRIVTKFRIVCKLMWWINKNNNQSLRNERARTTTLWYDRKISGCFLSSEVSSFIYFFFSFLELLRLLLPFFSLLSSITSVGRTMWVCFPF